MGVLVNPLNPVWENYPEVLNDAARALGIELVRVEARGLAEIDQAFAPMAAQQVDGLFGLDESTLVGGTPVPKRIMELVASIRLPSVSDDEGFASGWAPLVRAPTSIVITRGAANYIDRILQGAKVAELPVVHPTKFILVVNLKTAEQLGSRSRRRSSCAPTR